MRSLKFDFDLCLVVLSIVYKFHNIPLWQTKVREQKTISGPKYRWTRVNLKAPPVLTKGNNNLNFLIGNQKPSQVTVILLHNKIESIINHTLLLFPYKCSTIFLMNQKSLSCCNILCFENDLCLRKCINRLIIHEN